MHMHYSCCQWNYCSKEGFLLCITELGTSRDQNIVENGLDLHGNLSKRKGGKKIKRSHSQQGNCAEYLRTEWPDNGRDCGIYYALEGDHRTVFS